MNLHIVEVLYMCCRLQQSSLPIVVTQSYDIIIRPREISMEGDFFVDGISGGFLADKTRTREALDRNETSMMSSWGCAPEGSFRFIVMGYHAQTLANRTAWSLSTVIRESGNVKQEKAFRPWSKRWARMHSPKVPVLYATDWYSLRSSKQMRLCVSYMHGLRRRRNGRASIMLWPGSKAMNKCMPPRSCAGAYVLTCRSCCFESYD